MQSTLIWYFVSADQTFWMLKHSECSWIVVLVKTFWAGKANPHWVWVSCENELLFLPAWKRLSVINLTANVLLVCSSDRTTSGAGCLLLAGWAFGSLRRQHQYLDAEWYQHHWIPPTAEWYSMLLGPWIASNPITVATLFRSLLCWPWGDK